MSDDLKSLGVVILIVWFVVNTVTALVGVSDRLAKQPNVSCNVLVRASILLPGHQVGCWLGEPLFAKDRK